MNVRLLSALRRCAYAAVLGVALSVPQDAHASCINNSAEARLQTFCLVEESKGKLMLRETFEALDARIKREGYARGLGLPGEVPAQQFTASAFPILDYSSNVNGGNPVKPLVLGEVTFDGDPALYRKEGALTGAGISTNGRVIYGPGRYADLSIGASYLVSPEHSSDITRIAVSACSKNQIVPLWFVDACLAASRTDREISDDQSRNLSLSAVHLIKSESGNYHQLGAGIRRVFDTSYDQNQLVFEIETIRPAGIYTALSASIGAAVENELATRQSISATIGTSLAKRPLRATVSMSHSDGGKLLGIDRADRSQSISLTYALSPRFSLSLGYQNTDSSIDYFDTSEPTLSLQFAPVTF